MSYMMLIEELWCGRDKQRKRPYLTVARIKIRFRENTSHQIRLDRKIGHDPEFELNLSILIEHCEAQRYNKIQVNGFINVVTM